MHHMKKQNDSTVWLKPSEALTRFKARPVQNTDSQELLLGQRVERFGFRLGDHGLLIGEQTISEVLDPLPIYSVPNTSTEWLGLVNLRGNLVPIYNLSAILGWQRKLSAKTMMLFLGQGETMVGILIDGLPWAANLDQALAHTPSDLPEILKLHVRRAYKDQEITWLEFDYTGFFEAYIAQTASITN